MAKMLWTAAAGVAVLAAALVLAMSAADPPPDLPGQPPGTTADKPPDSGQLPPEEPETFEPPNPPAASERVRERHAMVDKQIANPRYGATPVKDEKVLQVMRTVPRHVFVPRANRSRAYLDTPLPIGHGQTISQPYMVGLMTELLKLTPESKVLEIGTGSGYQAAVLAHLTPHVYTIEIIEPLQERAEKTLRDQGYDKVNCRRADGYYGWEEEAPFDAIIVTCAAGHLPPSLWEQLKPEGRIVIPIGGQYEVQRLVLVTKQGDGSRRSQTIMGVRFVPLTREDEK
ncbi:MAG: protein-L-isoaspartate(D-aspartate) O-methyltransferase [Phycisphaerales bacterium]|nr:MAG: protein-L-isoaspartate(D-aspartate) O-methyltransferase [Phycisphaerales bacterium]